MTKLEYQELFLFAAKVGSLEGYLFNRRKVEPLDNWVMHISEMYRDLSPAVKKEINPELVAVLHRLLMYGGKLLEPALKSKLEQVFAAAQG